MNSFPKLFRTILPILILFTFTAHDAIAVGSSNKLVHQMISPPPGPPVCRTERSIAIGRCICYLTVSKAIKLVNQKAGIKQCVLIFDKKKTILTFRKFCKGLKKKGKLNIKKLVRAANKILKICVPTSPKIVLAK